MEQQTGPDAAGGSGLEVPGGSGLAWLQSFAEPGDELAGEAAAPDPGAGEPGTPQAEAARPGGEQEDEIAAGGRGDPAGEEADRTAAAQAAAGQAEAAYAAMARAAAAAVPGTGEPRVDAALQLLERLPGLPVSDHPELFEQVHAQLSEVLGELESGPRGPAGG